MIKKIATAAALVVSSFAMAFTVGTLAMQPAAAATSKPAPPTWSQRTCSAFTAYQAHPTSGRLTRLVTDSTHLGRSYLKADVLELAADVSSPSKSARQATDVALQYVGEDCYGGA